MLTCLMLGCDETSPPVAAAAPTCVEGGLLSGEIFGAYEAALDWRDDGIECDGMPRPRGEGARLRFAGETGGDGDERRLAFILGIPALLEGQPGKELPTNVTLIEEGGGRFFSTPDTSACFTDIEYQDPAASARHYRIGGVLYCVAPLPELHGSGSVSFADLSFAGEIDWEPPE